MIARHGNGDHGGAAAAILTGAVGHRRIHREQIAGAGRYDALDDGRHWRAVDRGDDRLPAHESAHRIAGCTHADAERRAILHRDQGRTWRGERTRIDRAPCHHTAERRRDRGIAADCIELARRGLRRAKAGLGSGQSGFCGIELRPCCRAVGVQRLEAGGMRRRFMLHGVRVGDRGADLCRLGGEFARIDAEQRLSCPHHIAFVHEHRRDRAHQLRAERGLLHRFGHAEGIDRRIDHGIPHHVGGARYGVGDLCGRCGRRVLFFFTRTRRKREPGEGGEGCRGPAYFGQRHIACSLIWVQTHQRAVVVNDSSAIRAEGSPPDARRHMAMASMRA